MADGPIPDLDQFGHPPKTGLGRLADRLGSAASWLFMLAVAISAYEVAMRYLFARPSSWAHVTVTTLCAVGFAVGGAYAMARGEHIRISVLSDRFRPGAQRACTLLGLAVGALYLAGLGWGLWLLASESVWRFGDAGDWRPELTPGPPNWPLPALAKALLLLMTLAFLALVAERALAVLRGRD